VTAEKGELCGKEREGNPPHYLQKEKNQLSQDIEQETKGEGRKKEGKMTLPVCNK